MTRRSWLFIAGALLFAATVALMLESTLLLAALAASRH